MSQSVYMTTSARLTVCLFCREWRRRTNVLLASLTSLLCYVMCAVLLFRFLGSDPILVVQTLVFLYSCFVFLFGRAANLRWAMTRQITEFLSWHRSIATGIAFSKKETLPSAVHSSFDVPQFEMTVVFDTHLTSSYTRLYVARLLVSARLVVTDTLLVHFRSNLPHWKTCVSDGQTHGPTDGPTDRHTLLQSCACN